MKSKLKQQNAITLVALIITIIVLLILAMVSISLVMNSGVIDKSKYAVDKYSEEEIAEQLKLAYSEYQMSQFTTPIDIEAKLKEIFGNDNVSDVSLANNKLKATIYGKAYQYNVATGTAGEKKPRIGDLITKDNYGDYIDLGQDVVKTSATTDDWRILYNDKAGHVYAILADYLPNTNEAVTASGVHVVDNTTYNVNSITSADDLITCLNHPIAWQSLIPEGLRSKCEVKGATTAEIIMASYNEKYGTNLNYTDYPYLRTNPNDSSSSIDTLYTPHPGNSDYNGCWGYWLSLPNSNSAWEVNCYGGRLTTRIHSEAYDGICPVVSLPSDLQVTNNGGVWSLAN